MKRKTNTLVVWSLLIGLVLLALFIRDADQRPAVTSYDSAMRMIDNGEITGYHADGPNLVLTTDDRSIIVHGRTEDVLKKLREAQIPYAQPSASSDLKQIAIIGLVTAGVVFGLVVFLRKMRGGSMQTIFELRKSKARSIDNSDKAQFADIGGNQQAVELLGDIVDFLRSPEKWTSSGLRIPRGILVIGPPGTGKTLLARAVAGETKSAFLYTSATEFVEMFVGVGAARVRDTFEKAVAQQPAVIFIDELDAVGRRRGSGHGTMHEEREQTLNQLLVSLDGIEQNKRLVVIAATNRPDVLDAALLRPGRFDRTLRLSLPDQRERLEILKIHTRTKPRDNALSLPRVAEQTEGFSGADLEALMNAAGILAVRRSRSISNTATAAVEITHDDCDRAREEMVRSTRHFNRLESVLVDSVSQFAEPTSPAAARVTLAHGTVIEGDILWMNASHIKIRLHDGAEVILAKENASQIESMENKNTVAEAEFTPDRWSGRTLDAV